MQATQSGGGERVGMTPGGGKPDLLQHPALSDSLYYTASPGPERGPSGGCHRNVPQGGFIWL